MVKTKTCLYCIMFLALSNLGALADEHDPSEQTVKQTLISETSLNKAQQSIDYALKAGRGDLLVLAVVSNPSWDIKGNAVKAIGQLPNKSAANAVIAIIQRDELWTEALGGEMWIIQQAFVSDFKNTIHSVFMTDAVSINLFDKEDRERLLTRLKEQQNTPAANGR